MKNVLVILVAGMLLLMPAIAAYPAEVFKQLYGASGINETLYIGKGLPSANVPTYLTPIELNKSHIYCVIVGDLGDVSQVETEEYRCLEATKNDEICHDLFPKIPIMVEIPNGFNDTPVELPTYGVSSLAIEPRDMYGKEKGGATIGPTNFSMNYYIMIFLGNA